MKYSDTEVRDCLALADLEPVAAAIAGLLNATPGRYRIPITEDNLPEMIRSAVNTLRAESK